RHHVGVQPGARHAAAVRRGQEAVREAHDPFAAERCGHEAAGVLDGTQVRHGNDVVGAPDLALDLLDLQQVLVTEPGADLEEAPGGAGFGFHVARVYATGAPPGAQLRGAAGAAGRPPGGRRGGAAAACGRLARVAPLGGARLRGAATREAEARLVDLPAGQPLDVLLQVAT